MMTSPTVSADVVVVGGGPAGSSVAGLLAQAGFTVVLLERDRFPRYHIGESLITGCLAVVDELGLRDRLEGLGFVRKFGGTLVWSGDVDKWTFEFIEGGPYAYSYQVRRADYDALLLARARELGVRVLEETQVQDVLFDGGRVSGVRYGGRGAGPAGEVTARLVIDASGQARVIGRRVTAVTQHEDLRNVAVWTYYQGAGLFAGREAGNILVENVPGGWFWAIPLHDGTMSVGYVTPAAEAGPDLPRQFGEKVGATRELRRLLEAARPTAGFRTARDWSYSCEEFYGPGWALVGDAAAFIDPLFSTGVALASLAARALAQAATVALRDPSRAEPAMAAYQQGYQKFLDDILNFVRFFYDSRRDRQDYFDHAQELIDPARTRPPREAFVSLISGLAAATPIFAIPADSVAARP